MPKYPPQPIAIEYDSRGKRLQRVFTDHYKARQFFVLKDKAGRNPTVKKVNSNQE
jgi:hypothetical protein